MTKEADIQRKIKVFENLFRKKLTKDQYQKYMGAFNKKTKSTQKIFSVEWYIDGINFDLKYISESSLSPDLKIELINELKKIKDEFDTPKNYTLYIISAFVLLFIILLAFFILKKK